MRTAWYTTALLFAALAAVPHASAQCSVTFNPLSGAPPAPVTNETVGMTVSGTGTSTDNCARTVSSNNPSWLTVSFGQSGSGSGGSFGYTVTENLSPQPRTGTITVLFTGKGNTATFTVKQAAASCSYLFSPASFSLVAKNQIAVPLQVNTKCTWSASTTSDWMTLSSAGPFTGPGSITIAVTDNSSTSIRRGTVQINDQNIQVQQSGVLCTFAVTPPLISVISDGGSAKFNVSADPVCSWSASNTATWITLPTVSGIGSGTLTANIAANTTPVARSAKLNIAGQSVTVMQGGVGISFSAASIQNASSFAGGALSPGEIFVLYGSGMGPQTLAALQTTPDGTAITSSLGNTRVLFDGVPSPMIYSSATQVSAIVPYSVLGPVAHITVEYQGVPSPPVTVNILAATPGIFTTSQTGTGQGAVRNQDFSVNGPGNAAKAGDALIIYWTGGGTLSLPVVDGALVSTAPPYPVVTFPLSVSLGSADAQVLYSGAVPTLAPGILQTNIVIPPNAPKGDAVPLLMRLGDYVTQTGVTVAIQ